MTYLTHGEHSGNEPMVWLLLVVIRHQLLLIFHLLLFFRFQIVKERVIRQYSRSSFVWNTPPGALVTLPEYSSATDLWELPFFWTQLNIQPNIPVPSGINVNNLLLDPVPAVAAAAAGRNGGSSGGAGSQQQQHHQFTALIYATQPVTVETFGSSPLVRLVKMLAKSTYLDKVRLLLPLWFMLLIESVKL